MASSIPYLLSVCGTSGQGIGQCDPCNKTKPIPQQVGGTGGIPAFTLADITINQIQIIQSPTGSVSREFVGGVTYHMVKDCSSCPIRVAVLGGFGTFLTVPPPYTVSNLYQSFLTITNPYDPSNQSYQLQTIEVGGTNSPADVSSAQQAAISQAYSALGL